jgi:hypothetical protein
MDEVKSKRESILERMANKIISLKSDHRKILIREKVRHEFIQEMIPAIDRLAEQGLDVDYGYGSISLYLKDDPDTHDKAWEIVSTILDEFAKDGITAEVRKEFNAWKEKPFWNWRIYFDWGKFAKAMLKGYNKDFNIKDVSRLYITVPNAEPDPDCVPRQEVSITKSWVCSKE